MPAPGRTNPFARHVVDDAEASSPFVTAEATAARILDGRTTKADVVALLGPSGDQSDGADPAYWYYYTERTESMTVVLPWAHGGPIQPDRVGHYLFLHFDDGGIVRHHQLWTRTGGADSAIAFRSFKAATRPPPDVAEGTR